jgi:HAD superfamily hydrolase (TIGR01509 family)
MSIELPAAQAVLFDFDGTLVNTMPLHYEAYRNVFADMGVELSREDFFPNAGGKASETIPKFLHGRNSPLTISEIHHLKKERIKTVFATEAIELLPAASFLPLFEGRVKLGLVSSGSREGIDILLDRLNWSGLFDVIVSGDDILRSKPHPEPYILAVRKLDCDPARALAFEDTPDGIASARAAGMNVIDVSGNASWATLA